MSGRHEARSLKTGGRCAHGEACGPLANLPERQAAGGGKGLRVDGGASGALRGAFQKRGAVGLGGTWRCRSGPEREAGIGNAHFTSVGRYSGTAGYETDDLQISRNMIFGNRGSQASNPAPPIYDILLHLGILWEYLNRFSLSDCSACGHIAILIQDNNVRPEVKLWI